MGTKFKSYKNKLAQQKENPFQLLHEIHNKKQTLHFLGKAVQVTMYIAI